eukprot:718879-Pleurochrysis_carterae.AAC.1
MDEEEFNNWLKLVPPHQRQSWQTRSLVALSRGLSSSSGSCQHVPIAAGWLTSAWRTTSGDTHGATR